MAIRKKTPATRRVSSGRAKPKKNARKPAARKDADARANAPPQPDKAQAQHHHKDTTPDYNQFFAQMSAPFLNSLHAVAGAQNSDSNRMTHNWIDSQRQHWQSMLEGMQQPKAAQNMWQAFGQSPFMHMPHSGAGFTQHAAASPGAAFADRLSGGRAFNPFDQLASLPGLGYLREQHEEFSRLYKAWQAHEAAQQKYNAEMARVLLEALTCFESTLVAPPADQKPFTSLKDIYAHWINICEDVYARFAGSPQHTALYGDVVNTLSSVKREMTVAIDHWAAQMNLPTRAEVDSLHQRMHEMRRDMREMKRQSKDSVHGKRRRT